MSNQSLASPIDIFNTTIADAERILTIFDKLDKTSQQEHEVLKRASLIKALTAWKTFIEGWLRQKVNAKLCGIKGSFSGDYIAKKFNEANNRLHNSDSSKLRQPCQEFLSIDITEKWRWAHYEPKTACAQLNSYLSLRGEIVYHSRQSECPKNAHVVKREDVDKAIRFIKGLVDVIADCILLQERYIGLKNIFR